MTVYSYDDVRERLSTLLERALAEGQVNIRSRDSRVFTIRLEQPLKTSPLDVRSVNLSITKLDILEAIRESRDRF